MNKIYYDKPFQLECGEILEQLEISFSTYGVLSTDSNVVWVLHALTANSDITTWWTDLIGRSRAFDPQKDFIICVNNLGSCYGTTGPTTPMSNRRPLLEYFPLVTIKDMVGVNEIVRNHLKISKINLLVGASLGGQIAVEWSIQNPTLFDKQILIATNARHSAYGIAFNESQRLAILADPSYGNGEIDGGRAGLIAARSVALLSYRSYAGYQETQLNPGNHEYRDFLAAQYQTYQGQKLADRFSTYSYFSLTRSMDSHNVGRGRESILSALLTIKAKTLVIGIQSDHLFPVEEQEFLARGIKNSSLEIIESQFGHDGFLIETEQLSELITRFKTGTYKKTLPTIFRSDIELIKEYQNN